MTVQARHEVSFTSASIRNSQHSLSAGGVAGRPTAEASALCAPTALHSFAFGPAMAHRFIHGTGNNPPCGLRWKSLGVLELTALPTVAKEAWSPRCATPCSWPAGMSGTYCAGCRRRVSRTCCAWSPAPALRSAVCCNGKRRIGLFDRIRLKSKQSMTHPTAASASVEATTKGPPWSTFDHRALTALRDCTCATRAQHPMTMNTSARPYCTFGRAAPSGRVHALFARATLSAPESRRAARLRLRQNSRPCFQCLESPRLSAC